ncbi:hypothetical protein ACSAZL_09675 [Methanosarcina sp. T3]|uniref:hypothetical protein n=1 Tax=Methanosarcina sp. T3 TaxID=3439062 RepID=UPI003F854DAA
MPPEPINSVQVFYHIAGTKTKVPKHTSEHSASTANPAHTVDNNSHPCLHLTTYYFGGIPYKFLFRLTVNRRKTVVEIF